MLDQGRIYKVALGPHKGKKRLELEYTLLHIEKPSKNMIPDVSRPSGFVPVGVDFLENYFRRLTNNNCISRITVRDETFDGRLVAPIIDSDSELFLDLSPLGILIQMYKLHSLRTNRACIEIAQPSDIAMNLPPCLRVIDTKVLDNKLHFFCYFRSWNIYPDLVVDLNMLQRIKTYIANEINVEDGELIASSKAIHLYEEQWKHAEDFLGKKIEWKED